jgi:uncharacterized membrane protein
MSEIPSNPAPPATSSGLAPNVAGALSYLLGIITGVLFLVVEKENRFVRFHAAQSVVISGAFIVLNIAVSILSTVLAVIPVIGWLFGIVLWLLWAVVALVGFILWLVLMFRAFQGEEWRVPVAADYADKILHQPAVQ